MEAVLFRLNLEEVDFFKTNPNHILKTIKDIDNPRVLQMDKSWDGITFLLTGNGLNESNKHPLRHLFTSIDEPLVEETKYLPTGIQVLYPDEVQNLSDALHQALLIDPLIVYDAQKMSDLNIYPNFWLQDIEEDLPSYLMEYLEELGNFYFAAAQDGEAILIVMY